VGIIAVKKANFTPLVSHVAPAMWLFYAFFHKPIKKPCKTIKCFLSVGGGVGRRREVFNRKQTT
jgi:hypothetical protein